MAEPQIQKKNKKTKKKPEMSASLINAPTDKDIKNSISVSNDNSKQNLSQEVDIKASGNAEVEVTNHCKKEVDESAGKKKKKSKKKSKEVLKETFAENNNSEPLLNFSENGIQLVNHPEISVTITDPLESKDSEVKSVTDKMPPFDEEKQNDNAETATAKKKKKKKKKSNSNNLSVATTTSSETSFVTPTYTKVVTSDNTCVLVVNNENFSVDTKSLENSEGRKSKLPENSIDFSIPSEKQLGDVFLKKKNFAPDENVQVDNSVSIFPVLTNANSNATESHVAVSVDHNLKADSNISKTEIGETLEENVNESKPTKSQLKAERRAKQEAQRAAKLAKSNVKVDNISSTSENKSILSKENISKINEVTTEKISPKLPSEKESLHMVKLFSHLPQRKQLDVTAKIHPAILEIGFQYNKGIICGSNARCVALLEALREIIKDFPLQPDRNFCKDLESSIQSYLSFLNDCRPLSVSMINAIKFLKWEISSIPSDMQFDQIKERLYDFIDHFVKVNILIAKEAISNHTSDKIVDGDVILVFGFSSVVRDVLIKAHNKKKTFQVIVVDSRPKLEGLKMLRDLVKQGLHCSYMLINAVSYIMKDVSKVITGAHALLSNGYVMSRIGNKQIAVVASTYEVPVFVCCETYKFCERVLTDSFTHNEIDEPVDIVSASLVSNDSLKNWLDLSSLQPVNLLYDVTSTDLVYEIITEKGSIPCTSVPVLLRKKHGVLSQ